ncbi:MAG TPA: NAD+ synthase [Nitrososphaera sp.]|nr:NAD+ synthase [Nitrososphaera sp.]
MASSPAIDPARTSKKIQHFIRKYVSASSAKGLVMGLSGGLDSSVVLKLAVNALGPEKVYGLVMPAVATPEQDVNDAIDLAKELKVRYDIIRLEPIIEAYRQVLPDNERAAGNLTARIRTNILYYHAALNGYLVAGTSDKSEKFLGYFTKYGDGAADMLPIAGLYKTQVRRLASDLDIPASIIEKKSSPRLWKNHIAEDEIGMSYDQLDPILAMLVDRKKTPKQAAKKLGIPLALVEKVNEMIENSSHKRRPAPFAKL